MNLSNVQDLIAGRILETPAHRKVTWNDVVEFASKEGVPCSRQWLHANGVIAAAFRTHRERRQKAGVDCGAGVENGTEGVDLARQIKELAASLSDYDDRFARYIYNAQRRGLTVADLEKPIPPIIAR